MMHLNLWLRERWLYRFLKFEKSLFILLLLTPVALLIIVATLFSFHGLDTTDESFVLLSIIHWKTSHFNSFFGLALFPFWVLSFQNIVLFRLVGFFLLWLSSYFFTVSLSGLVAPTFVGYKNKTKAALSGLIPFTYYVNELVYRRARIRP